MIAINRIGLCVALGATVLMALANAPAHAQFICTTTATDQTCTNTGNIGAGLNQAVGTGQNATTINSGTADSLITQALFGGNGTTVNSGTVNGLAFAQAFGSGNAIGTNSGSVNGTFVTQAAGSGNASGLNTGTVTGGFVVQAFGNGSASATNSGFIGTALFAQTLGSGNATAANSGTAGGIQVFSGSGNANAFNSGALNGGIVMLTQAGGTMIVVNSGTVRNFGGVAIDFNGGPDTLTLLQSSFIIGAINLVGTNDTVNVRAGNQNLTFNTLAGATVTGTVPFAVSGNRVASVDPTTFALADRTLMDFTRAVSGLIERRAGEVSAPGVSTATGFASTENLGRFDDVFAPFAGSAYAANDSMVFKNPSMTTADGHTVWAKGFYGERIQQADGSILRSMTNFYGGAIGVDGLVRPDLRLGGFVGGGATRMSVDLNSGGANSDIVFGGGYGRYDIGAAFLDFALLGGHTQNRTTRNINNNLLANGLETATAGFGGWFISPEIAYGYRYGLGGNWTLTPTGRLRYVAAEFDGYAESGSSANLTSASRTLQNIEGRGDLTLTQTTTFANAEQFRTSAHIGLLGLQRIGDNGINTILLGQSLAFATPGKSSVIGGYAGLGFDWRTRSGVSFFAAGEYTAMSDSSTVVTGKGGMRIAF